MKTRPSSSEPIVLIIRSLYVGVIIAVAVVLWFYLHVPPPPWVAEYEEDGEGEDKE